MQVKVITTGSYDKEKDEFHLLSEADSEQFSNLIVSLLGGESEEAKEEKRYEAMEHGYTFRFDEEDENIPTASIEDGDQPDDFATDAPEFG